MRRGPLDDDRLTAVGLFFETAAGLEHALGRHLDCYGLPRVWLEVLLRVARSPGGQLRMSDLAAQVALSPSGLTRAVDKIEEAGLVARVSCPSDRRGAFVQLTEAGRERLDIHHPGPPDPRGGKLYRAALPNRTGPFHGHAAQAA